MKWVILVAALLAAKPLKTALVTSDGATYKITVLREEIFRAPWDEQIRILYTNDQFKDPFRLVSDFNGTTSDKYFAFSLSAFEAHFSKGVTTETYKQIFDNRNLDLGEALQTIEAIKMLELYRQGICTKEQLRLSIIDASLLTLLAGPSESEDVLARVNALSPVFMRLEADGRCVPLVGTELYVLANQPEAILYPQYYRAWFSAAALQAQVKSVCGANDVFVPGDYRLKMYECFSKARVPLKVTFEDIAHPIFSLGGLIKKEGWSEAMQQPYFDKMIDAGVYIPETALKYNIETTATNSRPTGDARLLIDSADLGTFDLADLNPLLVAMLSKEPCRKLLTPQGIQAYCLKPTTKTAD